MRLPLVLHIMLAIVFAGAAAIACRLLFLFPFWIGGALGFFIYMIVLVGIPAEASHQSEHPEEDLHHYYDEEGEQ